MTRAYIFDLDRTLRRPAEATNPKYRKDPEHPAHQRHANDFVLYPRVISRINAIRTESPVFLATNQGGISGNWYKEQLAKKPWKSHKTVGYVCQELFALQQMIEFDAFFFSSGIGQGICYELKGANLTSHTAVALGYPSLDFHKPNAGMIVAIDKLYSESLGISEYTFIGDSKDDFNAVQSAVQFGINVSFIHVDTWNPQYI
jgi:histidinol phosphatase-like enzyme